MSKLDLKTLRDAYLADRKNNPNKYTAEYINELENIKELKDFFIHMYKTEDIPIHYFPDIITDELGI